MRLLLCLWLLLAPGLADTFVRQSPDGQALETAITSYVTPAGVKIDLVAVVHLGDPSYYATLDKELAPYDAVLFEAVLDDGGSELAAAVSRVEPQTNVSLRADPSNPLTALQLKLCSLLGLAYQPTSMNYAAPNFVHADMTVEQLRRAMEKNRESPVQLFLKLLKRSLAETDEVPPELARINPLVFLTRDPTAAEQKALRRLLAHNISEMEGLALELQGTTLVSGRNGRCLAVMREQMKKGKRRIAILYGAAHMPDFDGRLRTELKARRVGRKWLKAWTLS